jgi:hypothetical protein
MAQLRSRAFASRANGQEPRRIPTKYFGGNARFGANDSRSSSENRMRFSAIELEPSTLCIGFESADDERLDVLPVDRIGNKQVGVLSNTDQDKAPSIRSVLSRARARHLHLHPRPRSVAGQDVA